MWSEDIPSQFWPSTESMASPFWMWFREVKLLKMAQISTNSICDFHYLGVFTDHSRGMTLPITNYGQCWLTFGVLMGFRCPNQVYWQIYCWTYYNTKMVPCKLTSRALGYCETFCIAHTALFKHHLRLGI